MVVFGVVGEMPIPVEGKERLRQLEHEVRRRIAGRLAEACAAFIEGRVQLGYSSLDVPLTLRVEGYSAPVIVTFTLVPTNILDSREEIVA